MTLYVLDTDTLSLFQRGHPGVLRKCLDRSPDELAVSIITVEEQLSGWYALIRKARRPEDLPPVYDRLRANVEFLAGVTILPFSMGAAGRYRDLLASRLAVGRSDLKIADVVLEHGGTLVTRNTRDFRRVPGLPIEDWAT